ncbi:MAG: ATP-binding cassette domain-containing protein, partial [Anaerolineaceae bacterium]
MTENIPLKSDDCPEKFLWMENLSKSYLEGGHVRAVLHDVTVNFCDGEFAAILGRSGSGKTTLLNLISGIDQADGGEIFLDGQSLTRMSDAERTLFRRKNIGFIFQFFNLIPTLTVWENLVLPLELNGKQALDDLQHARDLLAEVGLLDRRDTYPDRLSG